MKDQYRINNTWLREQRRLHSGSDCRVERKRPASDCKSLSLGISSGVLEDLTVTPQSSWWQQLLPRQHQCWGRVPQHCGIFLHGKMWTSDFQLIQAKTLLNNKAEQKMNTHKSVVVTCTHTFIYVILISMLKDSYLMTQRASAVITIPSECVLSQIFARLQNWRMRLDMCRWGLTKRQKRHTAGAILLSGNALFSKATTCSVSAFRKMTPTLCLTFLRSKQSSASLGHSSKSL